MIGGTFCGRTTTKESKEHFGLLDFGEMLQLQQGNSTINSALELAIHRLTIAGCDTPRLDAEVLMAHALHQERSWIYLNPKASLSDQRLETFTKLITRRENREPVAYIVGHKEFFGLEFLVNGQVLVPRPETELLVETAIDLTNNKNLLIADIGTGSGCIAITLAKHLAGSSVFAGDVSYQALQLARQNAICHAVVNQISFFAGDLIAPLSVQVDMIVSNPPYISQPELRAALLMPEVKQHEPRLALDGGQDGLAIIRRLLSQATSKLRPGGSLLVEIGSGQGQAVKQLASTYFPKANIQLKKDLAGLDRLLIIQN